MKFDVFNFFGSTFSTVDSTHDYFPLLLEITDTFVTDSLSIEDVKEGLGEYWDTLSTLSMIIKVKVNLFDSESLVQGKNRLGCELEYRRLSNNI